MGNTLGNDENKLLNHKETEVILYQCDGSILSSNYSDIEKDEIYNIQLCENDLILINNDKIHRYLYQSINSWLTCKNNAIFGFYLKLEKKTYEIILYVDDAKQISNKLGIITHKLVNYYKDL